MGHSTSISGKYWLVCEKLHGYGKDAFLLDFLKIFHLLKVSALLIIYFLCS